jgi:glutaryl-CoA dehydrogenase
VQVTAGALGDLGQPVADARVIEGKGSMRAVWQAHIELTEVVVPAENRLPGARSFKDTARVLTGTRSTCAGGRAWPTSRPFTPTRAPSPCRR